MKLWLPGYEHQPVVGAGLSVGPGRPKVILHTTETGPGTLQTVTDRFRADWGAGLPHFMMEGSRVVQLLPLNVGAYTLENWAGGADTNRSGPAVQVEIVRYTRNPKTGTQDPWTDEELDTLGKLLADIKRAGHDFDLHGYPRFWGDEADFIRATPNSRVRLWDADYDNFNSWTDHAHVGENSHYDVGYLDGPRVASIAQAHFDGNPTANTPEEFIVRQEDAQFIETALDVRRQQIAQDVNAIGDRIVGQVDAIIRASVQGLSAEIRSALTGEQPDVARALALLDQAEANLKALETVLTPPTA